MHHLHGCWAWVCESVVLILSMVRDWFRRRPPDEPGSDGPTILQFRLQ